MSNSKLATITKISPNSSPRTAKIDTITIHHMACKATAEACAVAVLLVVLHLAWAPQAQQELMVLLLM